MPERPKPDTVGYESAPPRETWEERCSTLFRVVIVIGLCIGMTVFLIACLMVILVCIFPLFQ